MKTPPPSLSNPSSETWFHGTDANLIPQILKQGLVSPCLTPFYDLAVVYSENFGDDGVVVELRLPDNFEQFLQPDQASLQEPTSWDERSSEDLQAEIEAFTKPWKDLDWRDSMYLVGAVQFHGVLGPDLIKAIDGDTRFLKNLPKSLEI